MPLQPPVPAKGKDPKEAMLLRLTAVELTGGFPHAMDPTFSRRTLALGDAAFGAVRESARNAHPFLARNAVAVLANYPRSEAADDLRKLWKESDDPVVRVRALLALARRGEKSIVPDLIPQAQDGKDEPMQALAIYALGLLRDPAGAQPVANLVKKVGIRDPDLLWSAIPALGRMRQGNDVLKALEQELYKKIRKNDTIKIEGTMVTPTAEEFGAKFKVLYHMVVIALAMAGEQAYQGSVLRRVDLRGMEAFHRATHYLLIETLAESDAGAALLKSKLIEAEEGEEILKRQALCALARAQRLEPAYLEALALDPKGAPWVRAQAIQILADLDEDLSVQVCAQILREFSSGKGDLSSQEAFVAAQSAGRTGRLDAADLAAATHRAFVTRAYSRREGINDPDITKARISLFPALLETLAIELGRTASPQAVPILQRVATNPAFPQGRAEAILGLGAIPNPSVDEILVNALEDKDGWVRYCAYKALLKPHARIVSSVPALKLGEESVLISQVAAMAPKPLVYRGSLQRQWTDRNGRLRQKSICARGPQAVHARPLLRLDLRRREAPPQIHPCLRGLAQGALKSITPDSSWRDILTRRRGVVFPVPSRSP